MRKRGGVMVVTISVRMIMQRMIIHNSDLKNNKKMIVKIGVIELLLLLII